MTKQKNIILSLLFTILLSITTTRFVPDVHAQMPDTTPQMPDTTPRMPNFILRLPSTILNLPKTLFRLPDTTPRMPDTTPQMPDTTPQMPDTTPRMPNFISNIISGFRKFLAPPSPSNISQPLSQFQQEPTKKKTPTPTLPKGASLQSGPYTYKPDSQAAKAGVPAFTVSAPSGWAKYTVSGNELVHFESQQIDTETVKGGEVTTNAVVIIRATDGYGSLTDFVNDYKASGKTVSGYKLQSSLPKKVAGEDGHELEFTRKTKIDDVEITIRELNYLTFKNGISFLIKGYASDSAWSEHASEIRTTLDSLKFN